MRKKGRDPAKSRAIMIAASALAVAALCLIFLATRSPAPAERPSDPEPPRETAERNDRDGDAFFMEDGWLHYADGETLAGIDVSTHQGVIDWQAVGESGVEFAILRAGYRGSTEGRLYEDEQFRYNLEGAKAAGLRVGVYFFSQARDEAEAEEEAAYACQLLDGTALDLPVYFDWEPVEGGTHAPAAWELDLTGCALAFCREVERGGYDAGVYFNQSFGYRYLDLAKLRDYSLWLAEYGDNPTFLYRYDCLQFTTDGAVPGIEADVDLDLLFLE